MSESRIARDGETQFLPLSINTTINPPSKRADRAGLVKVLIPLLDDKLPAEARKLFGVGQLADFQTGVLAQLDRRFHIEYGLTQPYRTWT